MNISLSDILLLAHAAFGVTGCLAALWVAVEAMGGGVTAARNIRWAAYATAAFIAAAWICGGYWYLIFYPAEKALILKGPWPFAHNVFMETKEHLFFVTAILAMLLPIVAREPVETNQAARKLVATIAILIVVTGLAVEGAGAIVDHGAKVALLRSVAGAGQ